MATLELNREQTELLRRTLDAALSGLRFEIAHTDQRDYKAFLRHREEIMQSLIAAAAAAEPRDLG
jgi:hypothetical protein